MLYHKFAMRSTNLSSQGPEILKRIREDAREEDVRDLAASILQDMRDEWRHHAANAFIGRHVGFHLLIEYAETAEIDEDSAPTILCIDSLYHHIYGQHKLEGRYDIAYDVCKETYDERWGTRRAFGAITSYSVANRGAVVAARKSAEELRKVFESGYLKNSKAGKLLRNDGVDLNQVDWEFLRGQLLEWEGARHG